MGNARVGHCRARFAVRHVFASAIRWRALLLRNDNGGAVKFTKVCVFPKTKNAPGGAFFVINNIINKNY
jgi:hypothetical protein